MYSATALPVGGFTVAAQKYKNRQEMFLCVFENPFVFLFQISRKLVHTMSKPESTNG